MHQLTIHQLADELRRQQLAAAQRQRPARRLLALRRTTRRVKRRMRRAARQAHQLRARRETEPRPAGAAESVGIEALRPETAGKRR